MATLLTFSQHGVDCMLGTCLPLVLKYSSSHDLLFLRKLRTQDCSFLMRFRVLVVNISTSVAKASDLPSINNSSIGIFNRK